jgi:hypothetical protein
MRSFPAGSLHSRFTAPALLAAGLLVAALVGCGTTAERRAADKPPVPPMQEPLAKAPVDSHLEEVRRNAAEQLECPVEEVNVVCLRRDTEGECVTVRADGCERTYEYQFGD